MASGFKIATEFKGEGNLDEKIDQVDKDIKGLKGSVNGLSKSFSLLKPAMAIGAMVGVGAGINQVTESFIDLDHAVTSAGAKFGEGFDRGTQGFRDLEQAAKNVGLTTEHSAAEAANGLNFLAMAGFSAEESLQLLPSIANLATAASLDFATSTDIASDSLGAFGMATGTADEKAKAFKSIMEQVSTTTNKTNMDLQMWFEGVQDGAPTFTAAGQTMSTFNTALGLLANNGIKGGKAGTALRGIMANLSKTGGKQAKTLKKLGVETKDAEGNFRDFADILGDLQKSLVGMGTAKQTGIIEKIFGKTQMSQMLILLGEGADKFRELRGSIEDSADADVKLAEKMRKSVKNSIALVQSALLGKGIDLLQGLFGGDDPAEALENFATKIQEFDITEIQQTLRTLIDYLIELGKWLFENKELLVGLGKAFIALKIGQFAQGILGATQNLIGMATQLGNISGGAASASGQFGTLAGKINAATAAIGAFSAGYAAGTVLWEQYSEWQELKGKRRNQAVKQDFKLRKMDLTQFSDKNLERMGALEVKALDRAKDDAEDWFLNDQEKKERDRMVEAKRASIDRINKELLRRKDIRSEINDSRDFKGGVQRKETVTRDEKITTVRFENKPENVTIDEDVDSGDMP